MDIRGAYIFRDVRRRGIARPIFPRLQQRGARGRGARRRPQGVEPLQPPPHWQDADLHQRLQQEAPENRGALLRNAHRQEVIQNPLMIAQEDMIIPVNAAGVHEQRIDIAPRGELEVVHEPIHEEPMHLVLAQEMQMGRVDLPERADGEVEEPIEYEVEDLEPEALPQCPFSSAHLAQPAKHRVCFKGEKRKQRQNCIYSPEDEKKPLFIAENSKFSLTKRKQLSAKDVIRRQWEKLFPVDDLEVDLDLLAELWMEAAFQPRTPRLMLVLKNKARRFISEWDCSKYSRLDMLRMALRAVGVAMTISPWEEEVRKLLLRTDVNKLVLDHNLMCKGVLKAPSFAFNKRLPGVVE